MIIDIKISSTLIVSFIAILFLSCENNYKEMKDIFATQNLPISQAYNIHHIQTDSGIVSVKSKAPIMLDFSNRKAHPYNEFTKGIEIITYNGSDSIKIKGDYAISYAKTNISEIKGNVVITNYKDRSVLETAQLFWDSSTNYCYTEEAFTLTQGTNITKGKGLETNLDLTKWQAHGNTADITVKE